MKLKNRVAIVTGAAQGIGSTIAMGLAKEGAKIVVTDILEGQDTVDAIKNTGADAIFVKTDVSEPAACEAMAERTMDQYGSIDVLVNNAAMFGNLKIRPFMDVTAEEWTRVLSVNAVGPFNCIKAVFPFMKDKGGKIINFASSSMLEGTPGMPHYVASKGAVMALTRCLARELGAADININSIAPGLTHSPGADRLDETKELPIPSIEEISKQARCLKHYPVPEDMVGTVVFLASDDSKNITGQMIVNDCGAVFY